MCYNCKHFTPDAPGGPFVCEAFPDGIPAAIVESVTDHREPVEGDRGVRYEAVNPNIEPGPFDDPTPGVVV
jgi:hypothetical protein